MNKLDVFDADEYISAIPPDVLEGELTEELRDHLRAQLFNAYIAGKEKAEEDCDC